jgi:hypothetical protein
VFQTEVHNLQPGQSFAFQPEGPTAVVTDIYVFDLEGTCYVQYTREGGVHRHCRDHTPVWIK